MMPLIASKYIIMSDTPEPEIGSNAEEVKSNNSSKELSIRSQKPWQQYFFDFLMIFLAVLLGFFADNLRENYMERVRMKQYAQSLTDDLKMDTALIQRTVDEKEWIESMYDSAKIVLASNDIKNNNEFIYFVERYLTLNDVFTSQDVTFQQLRSSGNFRYMRNISLYKRIADYYNLYTRYQSVEGAFGIIDIDGLSEIEAKLFNIKDLTSLNNENASIFYDLVLPSEKKLEPIVDDKENLNMLYLKVANAKTRTLYSRGLLSWLKGEAITLINEIKKEYKLK